MARGRWVGAAVVAVLLVAVVAGCGPSNGKQVSGSDELAIKTIAASTEAAGTARFVGSFEPSDGSGSPSGHFEGEIDFANDRSAVRSTSDAGGKDGAHAAETRNVDGYMYFTTPPELPEGFPGAGTKPWSRMRAPGSSAAMLPIGSSADVTGYLELLESMGAGTEVVGTETVRGVSATRYRVTPGKPPEVAAQVRAIGDFTVDDDQSGSLDVWADAAGRLRRFRSEFGKHGDGGTGGRYEVEVFDYGAPVTFEAPPLDQVTTQPFGSPEPGDYKLVASGSADGSPWKIYTAPQDGGRCLAVEADVPTYYSSIRGSDDGRVDLGCSVSASSSSVGPGGDPNSVVTHVDLLPPPEPEALPLADGRALLVSEVPDGTTAVTLRLRGGGTKAVTPAGGWFGAVLGPDDVAPVLEFATPSGKQECRLQGDAGYSCDGGGSDASSGSSSSSSSSSATSTVPPATAAR